MPARHTFHRGQDKSCVDLILSNTSTSDVEYDPDTLHGLSDHILVMTKVYTSHFHRVREPQVKGTTQTRYKWVEGSSISNYAQSANSWREFTNTSEFTAGLQTIVENTENTNDERAAAVEHYILQ